MKISMIVITLIIIVALLLMNIVLINRVAQADEETRFYQMKYEAMQGDVDVLTYDLITSRDSVRILNIELSNCVE
jgi:uncharacterized protein YoxC